MNFPYPLQEAHSRTVEGAEFYERMSRAARTSWKRLGKKITFYLPGMIRHGRESGRYPALSISGEKCELKCDHCRGKLLKPMIPAVDPNMLYHKGLRLWKNGALGLLLTGGSDREGRVNWTPYLETIHRIKTETGLMLSIHSGMLDRKTACKLKQAGVSQALIDVVGDDRTYERVFHLHGGLKMLRRTLDSIQEAGMELAPHLVAGVDHGTIHGEYRALELIREYSPVCVVIVVLFPFQDTPMAGVRPPEPQQIVDLFLHAREIMPHIPQSLGCERSRAADGYMLEELALQSGVNRMALHSDRALAKARELGLDIGFQKTCCSWQTLQTDGEQERNTL